MRALTCALLILALSAPVTGVRAEETPASCPTATPEQITREAASAAGAGADNACSRLSAYVAMGEPFALYEPYFEPCSRNPDVDTCKSTAFVIEHSSLSCSTETGPQLAARLHCGNN